MIYLDYNATTPLDEDVKEVMKKEMENNFGNPSSTHQLGIKAKNTLESARAKIAEFLNASPEEIIFTSGGSESNNMAIKGTAYSYQNKGKHIITTEIEHPAVIEPCEFLADNSYEITYLPVDKYGVVKIDSLKKAIRDDTILISVMHANNEVGSIQPIEEIAKIAAKKDLLFHTDAAQSVGKIRVDVKKLGIDMLSLAGHKLYAPKGIGVLYLKEGLEIEALIHGAAHENGRRAGTENLIFAAGLAEACEKASELFKNKNRDDHLKSPQELKNLRDYFEKELKDFFGEKIKINGHPQNRLVNTSNLSFLDYNSAHILNHLEGIAVSAGSACHSDRVEISSVLKAMGLNEKEGAGAIRFSLGKYTDKTEIETVLNRLKALTQN
ncbi:cysteine desulfurase [Halanaerobium sp. Z-7514]|uniref:cysteine desulfurase n=1 Tax=Halanaerobium polyolivorans TaxID=2886943 RepID=A0AAW4WXG5_9FIRM|nr:cysteine desulfurase family protein [Halanaerobium polyolivorans]MCC3144074.1 cysteine desulfurase [Halanaerobium polyolivorans]